MSAIALALGSALLWGSGDFFGGLMAKRVHVLGVALVSQLAGALAVLGWVLASGASAPELWRLAVGAGAGAGGIVALTAFYRGLAVGTMSIVAPISATGAAVPVLVGLAGGDTPSPLQALGIVAAFAGVALAAQERHVNAAQAADARRSVLLALVAAAGFGLFLTLLKPASAHGAAWAILAARAGALSVLVLVVLGSRPALGPAVARGTLATLVLVGLCDTGANALYATATGRGLLSVVAVLGSLYPVTTVILARLVLGERVRRIQGAGVGVVLAGVALIAAG